MRRGVDVVVEDVGHDGQRVDGRPRGARDAGVVERAPTGDLHQGERLEPLRADRPDGR